MREKELRIKIALLTVPWMAGAVFALYNWPYPGRWLGGLVSILALNAAVLWGMQKTREVPQSVPA